MPTEIEQRREAARLRKQKSRAKATPELKLPLPLGIQAALDDILAASPDFDDPRDFLSFQILRLHGLMKCDRHNFEEQTKRTVTLGKLDHFFERLRAEGLSESADDGS